jgi:hypothetical protein
MEGGANGFVSAFLALVAYAIRRFWFQARNGFVFALLRVELGSPGQWPRKRVDTRLTSSDLGAFHSMGAGR